MEQTGFNDEQLTAVLHERGQRVTVSLPTVYSTLELFEELGLVHRVGVSQGALLYDPRPEPHDHMVCDNCGKVEDVHAGVELKRALDRAKRGGFAPRRAEVRINGLCADCAALPS
jgi:Fe2+ or Zn2+ uptake regulation protein